MLTGRISARSFEYSRWAVLRSIREASHITGVPRQRLLSKRRDRSCSRARLFAYWLARTTTGMSFPDLGRMFDRDHSTIVNGVQRFERALENLEPWALDALRGTRP